MRKPIEHAKNIKLLNILKIILFIVFLTVDVMTIFLFLNYNILERNNRNDVEVIIDEKKYVNLHFTCIIF